MVLNLTRMLKIAYSIYHWCIAAPIILVLTILTALVTIVGCLFCPDFWGYYPAKIWARCWCYLLGVRVVVKNRELIDAKQSYVFVANHQGAFDIFSIYGFLNHNFKWMMRKGLTNIPLVGTACRAAGHILVDRRSRAAIQKTMTDAKRRLTRGMSIVVFPEGRRSDDGQMHEFKHSAFKLATEFGLPIVPIAIDGSYRVMPRDKWQVRPGKITLTINAPVMPVDDDNNIQQLTKHCHDTIENCLVN